MKDLTIIIPFYNDCEIRLKNMLELTEYLSALNIKYIIIEALTPGSVPIWSFNEKLEDNTFPLMVSDFPKSRLINFGVTVPDIYWFYPNLIKTTYMAWHDCDVRFKKEAYLRAYEMLESGCEFIRPYDGTFINLKGYNYNGKIFDNHNLVKETLHLDSCGGALFFNVEKFIEIGGMNEKFIGWGFEDNELRCRIEKFGYNIFSIDNQNCFHLNHPRGKNQSSEQHIYYSKNMAEYNKVKEMSVEEIKNYEFSSFYKKK